MKFFFSIIIIDQTFFDYTNKILYCKCTILTYFRFQIFSTFIQFYSLHRNKTIMRSNNSNEFIVNLLWKKRKFNMFMLNIERGARSECVILRNMLSNEAVNASRMIDMHVSVYEAKCDNPLAHIHVRMARGEISRYWSSYIKLNYLLSSDSIHFLAFSSCEMQDCQLAPRYLLLIIL